MIRVCMWLVVIAAGSVCAVAQEQRQPVLTGEIVRVCEGRFHLDCVRRAVRLPKAEAGTIQFIEIEERAGEALVGNSHSTVEYWRDAFFASLPRQGGKGYVLQSGKGAVLSVWEPGEDRYERVVLWGEDIQKLDADDEIVFVAYSCNTPGCETGSKVLEVCVWGGGDVGPMKARAVVQKAQEALGVEKFRLVLADNPAFWGVASVVPAMVPAMGVLGLEGLKRVHSVSQTSCAPTHYGIGAKCGH